jgi:hypothetical protein
MRYSDGVKAEGTEPGMSRVGVQEERMTKFLLASAGVALGLALSSSAWAGADLVFSNGNIVTDNDNLTVNEGGTGYQDSFNTTLIAVSKQELSATATDNKIIANGGKVKMGDARVEIGGGSGSVSGVSQTVANSGVGSIVQQGMILSTAAKVSQ